MPKRGDSVYKRKDGLWEARYVKEIGEDGRKRYGSVYARSCGEAKEKRRAALDSIILYGTAAMPRAITVGRLGAEWLDVNRGRVKPSTHRRYEGYIHNYIADKLGARPAIGFGAVDVQAFAAWLVESGLGQTSVNSILIFLHSCFKYGHRQYGLPMPEFVYLAKERRETCVLSPAEQGRLEAYLVEDVDLYKFGVLLTLYTGLRVGELCALRWRDVASGSITVRGTMQRLGDGNGSSRVVIGSPKTRTSARTIPLPQFISEYLDLFGVGRSPDDFVLGSDERKVVEPRFMQNKFKKYIAAVGIEGATFHTLRHSFATRCVDTYGFDVKTLSEILGHSSVEITLNLYVHSSMDRKRDQMAKLQLLS